MDFDTPRHVLPCGRVGVMLSSGVRCPYGKRPFPVINTLLKILIL